MQGKSTRQVTVRRLHLIQNGMESVKNARKGAEHVLEGCVRNSFREIEKSMSEIGVWCEESFESGGKI